MCLLKRMAERAREEVVVMMLQRMWSNRTVKWWNESGEMRVSWRNRLCTLFQGHTAETMAEAIVDVGGKVRYGNGEMIEGDNRADERADDDSDDDDDWAVVLS